MHPSPGGISETVGFGAGLRVDRVACQGPEPDGWRSQALTSSRTKCLKCGAQSEATGTPAFAASKSGGTPPDFSSRSESTFALVLRGGMPRGGAAPLRASFATTEFTKWLPTHGLHSRDPELTVGGQGSNTPIIG